MTSTDDSDRAQKAIEEALELARGALGMEAGYVAEFSRGEQLYRALAGDAESFDMRRDEGFPLDGSYCQRMVVGDIGNVVADSSEEREVRDLAITELSRIGSYVGVPITFSDGTVYGTVCVVDHEARPELAERDVLVLKAIARLMGAELEREALERDNRRQADEIRRLEEALNETREALQVAQSSSGGEEFVDLRGWRAD